ncbi:hypothetical protein P3H15_32240 [Rhodococcus sp. T2V]|nr:hypothetical protein [Rhodococcus sp. T2V]MDF3309690.1 hypothetical protein [Rhodococcus sp. T2V]
MTGISPGDPEKAEFAVHVQRVDERVQRVDERVQVVSGRDDVDDQIEVVGDAPHLFVVGGEDEAGGSERSSGRFFARGAAQHSDLGAERNGKFHRQVSQSTQARHAYSAPRSHSRLAQR